MRKEDWGDEIRPYNEMDDVRRRGRGGDDWDDDEDEERRHPYTRPDASFGGCAAGLTGTLGRFYRV